jgi:hypothetical protein
MTMQNKFSLTEITIDDYLSSKPSDRIIECIEPNFYYKLEIGGSFIYIDSNSKAESFTFESIDNVADLIFASEDRIYIFSLLNGKIKFSSRTFDPTLEIRLLDDFYLIFTEKMMFVILSNRCILHSIHQFSDVIQDISITGRAILVNCFDENAFKIDI